MREHVRLAVAGTGLMFPAGSGLAYDVGTVGLAGAGWPAAFTSRMVSLRDGEPFSFTVVLDDDTGAADFLDASNAVFHVERPCAGRFTPDWLRLLNAVDDAAVSNATALARVPDLARPEYDLSHLVTRWTLVYTNELASGRIRQRLMGRMRAASPAAGAGPVAPTNLVLTSIAHGTGMVELAAAWPPDDPPPDGILDLFVRHCLDDPLAQWACSVTNGPGDSSCSFSVPFADVPGWIDPVLSTHVGTCTAQTNTVTDAFLPGGILTNVVWLCDHIAATNQHAFFSLGTRVDTDGDGLADAFERHVSGSCTNRVDTDGDGLPDGWELALGTDPRVADYASAPRLVAGGDGPDEPEDLRAAFDRAQPYSVIEIAPGVHEGDGWTGLTVPSFPILLTTANGGRDRSAVLRHRVSSEEVGSRAALTFGAGHDRGTVVRGITVELDDAEAGELAGFACTGGATPTFVADYVRLGAKAGRRSGWTVEGTSGGAPLVLASCVVEAGRPSLSLAVASDGAVPLWLESCSFLRFHSLRGSAVVEIDGDASDAVENTVRNCLFTQGGGTSALKPYREVGGTEGSTWVFEGNLVPRSSTDASEPEGAVFSDDVHVGRNGWLISPLPENATAAAPRFAETDIDGDAFGVGNPIGADAHRAIPDDGTDTDGDGVTDHDELYVHGTNPWFADTDGDRDEDAFELGHGSDPTDPDSFCCHISVVVTNAFVLANVTNYVTVAIEGAEASALTFQTTDRVVANECAFVAGPYTVVARGYRDYNRNGVRDADEVEVSGSRTIQNASVTLTLAFGVADADGDGMPDDWERYYGLLPNDATDAYANPDGDGLINLHEYWCLCDPLEFDGANTVLSGLTRAVDDRIISVNAVGALERFTDYRTNGAMQLFLANSNFWATTVDLSCASMWNDATADMWGGACNSWHMAGTAISRRHILCAHHYGIPNGTTLYFRTADNQIAEAVVSASRYVGTSAATGGDMRVCLLDRELPQSVAPVKLLPANYASYIKTGRGLPVTTLDQEEKLLIGELDALKDFEHRAEETYGRIPLVGNRVNFYEEIVAGDSGNPRFLVLGNTPILVCLMWHGGVGRGCFVTHYREEIQQAMDLLLPGYEVEECNLEGYEVLP